MASPKALAALVGAMAVDDAVLRSARNAFLALMLVAVGVGVFQFVTSGAIAPGTAVIWATGAAVFYVSKYYYGRAAGD
jgi:hypothetical protein